MASPVENQVEDATVGEEEEEEEGGEPSLFFLMSRTFTTATYSNISVSMAILPLLTCWLNCPSVVTKKFGRWRPA